MAPSTDSTFDLSTVLRGAVSGVVAFLLGYALTYAWLAPAAADALRGVNAVTELVGGQAVPTWKAVGWLFYNAHLVATRLPGIVGGDRLVNFVDAWDDGSIVLLYVLVPVMLALSGAAVARYGRSNRVGRAAVFGATVVVGYLPAAVVGAILVGHTLGGGFQIAPDFVTAVALAGLVYPVSFGAVGGVIWYWLASVLGS